MAVAEQPTQYPGISKRGSRYSVRYRVNGKYHRASARTLQEARELKRARETARDRGEHDLVTEGKAPLREYAVEWVERYQGNGRKGFAESTREEYRRDLDRYVLPQLGRFKLSGIRHRDVSDWVAWLCDEAKQGVRVDDELKAAGKKPKGGPVRLSDATVRRILVPLRSCLATARREGLIRSNPCDDVPLPNRPQIEDDEETVKAMTREELSMFLRVCPAEHRLMFRFLAATGLRWSELAALQWGDLKLDGEKPCVRVKRALEKKQRKGDAPRYKAPKSKYGKRTIPLSDDLARELRAKGGDESPPPTTLVFTSSNGRPMRQENIRRRILQPAAGEAGVAWIGFHAFRHTCASMLFAEGRNIKQVQRWLGHHSPAFTLETYVHLLDDGVGGGLEIAGSGESPEPVEAAWTQSEPTQASAVTSQEAVLAL